MDKQTFCSSQTTSNTSRYAAALYRRGTRDGAPRVAPGGWAGRGGPPPNARRRGARPVGMADGQGTGLGHLEGLPTSHAQPGRDGLRAIVLPGHSQPSF